MLKGRIKGKKNEAGVGIVGRIKIGSRRANGKPQSHDYFLADAPKYYQDMFREIYGEKPNRIMITFISDEITHSCYEQHELRNDKGTLVVKTDGHTVGVLNPSGKLHNKFKWYPLEGFEGANDAEKEANFRAYCSQLQKEISPKKGWETRLYMNFMLPEIKGLIAEWRFVTKGEASTIKEVVKVFDLVQANAGTVLNIPFDLTVKFAKGEGTRFPVVNLIPNISPRSMGNLNKLLSNPQVENAGLLGSGILTDENIAQIVSDSSIEAQEVPYQEVQ